MIKFVTTDSKLANRRLPFVEMHKFATCCALKMPGDETVPGACGGTAKEHSFQVSLAPESGRGYKLQKLFPHRRYLPGTINQSTVITASGCVGPPVFQ
jgi:hypothetical protein